jgi:hypothetical protein
MARNVPDLPRREQGHPAGDDVGCGGRNVLFAIRQKDAPKKSKT